MKWQKWVGGDRFLLLDRKAGGRRAQIRQVQATGGAAREEVGGMDRLDAFGRGVVKHSGLTAQGRSQAFQSCASCVLSFRRVGIVQNLKKAVQKEEEMGGRRE